MILCSSGAFFSRRDDGTLFVPGDDDVDALVEFGPQIAVAGIEVLVTRLMVGRLHEVAKRLARTRLRFPVVHAPKRLGSRIPDPEAVRQLDETFRFAREIGASTVVLHLWDLPEGDVRFDERLEAAVVAADIGERRGVRLAIETIPCLRGTPLENVRRVVEHDPRLVVALDTEFVSYHEELDAALDADWLWQHVQHIHIKDFDTDLFDADGRRRYLLPGDGAIDFAKVFEVLERRCFRGSVSLEASAYTQDGRPDVAALNHAISRMSLEPWRFA